MKSFKIGILIIISLFCIDTGYAQFEKFDFEQNKISISNFKTTKNIEFADLDSIILATMNQYHLPGVATAIIKNDQVIWKNNYGHANIENNLLVNDSTSFLLASVSKTFTGLALMQLWEQGLFNLDDNINNFLPANFQVVNPLFPNDAITFGHLLTHTSSMDRDDDLLFTQMSWGNDSPVALDSFLIQYLMPGGTYYNYGPFKNYPPGTQWQYTNHGYALIGYLTEVIAEIPFSEYCQLNIFNPLNMNETAWFKSGLDTTNLAMPYGWDNVSYVPYGYYGCVDYPAGWLKSSSSDMISYLSMFLNSGQTGGVNIIDSSTIATINSIYYPNAAPFMGLTWFITSLNGLTVCEHSGGLPGCVTYINYSPTNDFGIIVLSNGEPWQGGLNPIIFALFDYALRYGEIYATSVELNSSYIKPVTDTLVVNAIFENPQNHDFNAQAVITSFDSTVIDSVMLYDDGSHNDGQANDGIWGNSFLPFSTENTFIVDVNTKDLVNGNYLYLYDLARFTTIGPLVVEDFYFYGSDTIPNHGDTSLKLKLDIKNYSPTATAPNVSAKLTPLDSNASIRLTSDPTYGNITAGSSVPTNGHYRMQFNNVQQDSIFAFFKVEILSDDYIFWQDTISIFMFKDPSGLESVRITKPTEYELKQNYPNPFNPTTTIEFSIPKTEFVTLKIYNIIGQQMATLVSDKLTPGNYKYEWDASQVACGVYLYKIETSDPSIPMNRNFANSTGSPTGQAGYRFVQTQKMIFIK